MPQGKKDIVDAVMSPTPAVLDFNRDEHLQLDRDGYVELHRDDQEAGPSGKSRTRSWKASRRERFDAAVHASQAPDVQHLRRRLRLPVPTRLAVR